MSKSPRRPSAVAAGIALLAAMSACGGTSGSSAAAPGALGLVVGAHANVPQPQLLPDLAEEVERAATAGAEAAFVVNAGTPTLLRIPMGSDANNDMARKRDAEQMRKDLERAVVASRAETPESDLLKALDQAARSVIGQEGPKTLLVIDSGLQTAPPLRFQEPGMLTADPTETVEYLQASGGLPDLTGVRVVFSGLGDTAPPQQPLTPGQRTHLTEIWTAIADASGADEVEVVETPLTGPSPSKVPPVTTVPLPPPAARRPAPAPRAVVTLTEEVVAFLPASTDYRSPADVVEVLRPLADRIRRDGGRVRLTGTTSSAGSREGRLALSRQRAEAVKASLVELGAPADLLETVGVGHEWPGYVMDRDTQDRLLPGPAAKNRSVIVELAGMSSRARSAASAVPLRTRVCVLDGAHSAASRSLRRHGTRPDPVRAVGAAGRPPAPPRRRR